MSAPLPDPPFAAGFEPPGERARPGFWRAMWLELAGLLLFVLYFNLVAPSLGSTLGAATRIALGLIMALVPAALWLSFFLSLDARSPEPRQLVVRTLAAAAFIYGALAGPVLHTLFDVHNWLGATLWSRLLGGILVVGIVEQSIVYWAVRFTVFDRPEFDERVDGVVYGVAAGLGLATVVNLMWVFERGGLDLDVGSVRIVVNTLAYGAIAGVMGYFIGQARFRRVPIWYLPMGLASSAVLSGLLFFLLDGSGQGLQPRQPWGDLALAAAVAVLALAAVFGLVARVKAEAPPLPTVAPSPQRPGPGVRPAPRVFAPLPIAAAQDEPEVVAEVESPADTESMDKLEEEPLSSAEPPASRKEAQG